MSDTAAAAPLDDIMLAMDVVDTLRHREHLVARELNEASREKDLLTRLRRIYKDQGLEVSDDILREGVRALKENRFLYTPPEKTFQVSLATLYVNRGKYIRRLIGVIVAGFLAIAGYLFGYELPRERAAEALQQEMTVTLPGRVVTLGNEIAELAKVDAARQQAVALMADAESAFADDDRNGARAAVTALAELRDRLAADYTMTIVSRPGELSGVWRIPDANPDAENFYVIVEALDRAGNPVTVPIRSEEDGQIRRVTKWGVRVAENVFARVRADKQDDGIIQSNRVAEKKRGYLEPEYLLPVMGGTITEW